MSNKMPRTHSRLSRNQKLLVLGIVLWSTRNATGVIEATKQRNRGQVFENLFIIPVLFLYTGVLPFSLAEEAWGGLPVFEFRTITKLNKQSPTSVQLQCTNQITSLQPDTDQH